MKILDPDKYKILRSQLVIEISLKGISNKQLLQAIGKVPRHLFMAKHLIDSSYEDRAFPIGSGQTISQPFTVAFQTELLQVEPGHKVLEIGTGSGYQTAILCELGANVYTIERLQKLFDKVQSFLPELGYHPHCYYGDGYEGLPEHSPFDRIIVTAGAPSIPPILIEQLKIGGRMVIPVGRLSGQKMTLIKRISETHFETSTHGSFIFVPLVKGKPL